MRFQNAPGTFPGLPATGYPWDGFHPPGRDSG